MPLAIDIKESDKNCNLSYWVINDANKLAKIVAWLYLRKEQHALKVLAALDADKANFGGNEIDNAIKRLKKKPIIHRDGLLFQYISWVAIKIKNPGFIAQMPQVIEASKGFDNVIIRLNENHKLSKVIICEDKATITPRTLIRNSIFPEFLSIEKGDKDDLILDAVTGLLQKSMNAEDAEKVIEGIHWKNNKDYRIAITAQCTSKKDDKFIHLFKGYKKTVKGEIDRRNAEILHQKSVRTFLRDFSKLVIAELEKIKAANVQ